MGDTPTAECDTPCTSTALVKILPPANTEKFGRSVAISGDTLVVGDPWSFGAAYVFSRQTSGAWMQMQRLTASKQTDFYFSSDIAFDGSTLLIGAYGGNSSPGAAYVFTLQAGRWVETQKLTAADRANDDSFGWNVAVHGER